MRRLILLPQQAQKSRPSMNDSLSQVKPKSAESCKVLGKITILLNLLPNEPGYPELLSDIIPVRTLMPGSAPSNQSLSTQIES